MALYLTFALTFLNFVGVSAARVVLSLYALDLGAHPFGVGVLVAMFYTFPLLLSWPIGTLSDRYGARRPLVFGGVCGLASMLIPYFVHELFALYAAAALAGLSLACMHVNVQNLVGLLSPSHERSRNFSNFSMVGAATNFVGPLVAGFSIDLMGHAAACLVIAVFYLIAVILLAVWGRVLPGGRNLGERTSRVLDSLADREILRVLAVSSLTQLGTDLFQFFMPVYGYGIGLSASVIGGILATFAAASVTVRLFLARLIARFGEEKLLAYSFYFGAASFLLIPFFMNAVVLTLISFAFGFGMGCGQPITLMLMFSRSAQGRSGETLGLRLTANNLMRAGGPALFGFLGSAFGLGPVFWISAVLMGAGGLLSRSSSGRFDDPSG